MFFFNKTFAFSKENADRLKRNSGCKIDNKSAHQELLIRKMYRRNLNFLRLKFYTKLALVVFPKFNNF